MGQYFHLVNVSKKQWIDPHVIGNGLKIGEQCGWKYSTEAVARHLIDPPNDVHPLIGSWRGDYIGFAGDYGDAHPVPGFELPNPIRVDAEKLYHVDEDAEWEDISLEVRNMMHAIHGIRYVGDGWCDIFEPSGLKVRPFMTPDMVLSLLPAPTPDTQTAPSGKGE